MQILIKSIALLTLCALVLVLAAPAMCSAELFISNQEQQTPVDNCCGGMDKKQKTDEHSDRHCPVCKTNLCSGIMFLPESAVEFGAWYEDIPCDADVITSVALGFKDELIRPPAAFC